MSEASPRPSPTLDVPWPDTGTTFRKEAYAALKRAITAMDIYDHPEEIRLDERRLSEGLGVSRAPIREAITLLEQEGFVRTRPRRGIFVVRKTKREIVEMITVMAARLAAECSAHLDVPVRGHRNRYARTRCASGSARYPLGLLDSFR
jgi:DNA-binding GntR family transcriptional regulator